MEFDTILSEDVLAETVELLVRFVEAAGALVIFTGAAIGFVRFLVAGLAHRHEPHRFVAVRLGLGRYLALGLEFQLASDVLRTAVAPTLREIAELAAVAAIRTALNYFLAREIAEERAQLAERDGADSTEHGGAGSTPGSSATSAAV